MDLELASKVSTKEPYYWGNENAKYRISALDLGIKKTSCAIWLQGTAMLKYTYNASFEELQSFEPHGYFISNGPGGSRASKGGHTNHQKS